MSIRKLREILQGSPRLTVSSQPPAQHTRHPIPLGSNPDMHETASGCYDPSRNPGPRRHLPRHRRPTPELRPYKSKPVLPLRILIEFRMLVDLRRCLVIFGQRRVRLRGLDTSKGRKLLPLAFLSLTS